MQVITTIIENCISPTRVTANKSNFLYFELFIAYLKWGLNQRQQQVEALYCPMPEVAIFTIVQQHIVAGSCFLLAVIIRLYL